MIRRATRIHLAERGGLPGAPVAACDPDRAATNLAVWRGPARYETADGKRVSARLVCRLCVDAIVATLKPK